MRAGKDVYCEKPMAHTIAAGARNGRVSRETGRLVQVGSQTVSMSSTQKAKEWYDSGAIGTVFMAECSIYRPNAIGAWRYPVPPDASPETIDWERYLGNAPKRPFDARASFSSATGGTMAPGSPVMNTSTCFPGCTTFWECTIR